MLDFFGRKRSFLIILILVFLLLCFSTRTDNLGDWDEANHASSTLFTYNFIRGWFLDPTFSFDEMIQRAVDYHAHYNYFTVLFIYPPLDMIFSVLIYMFFGVSIFTTNLATILEAILVLFFVYKLAKLFFIEKKELDNFETEKKEKLETILPLVAMVLVAFNAWFFNVATKNFIDMMLLLFIVSTSYLFIKFLKNDDTLYLYLSVAFLALGLLSKQLMVFMIPIMILVFLWEKRLKGIKDHGKSILKSIVIFLVFLIPMWIQIGLLISQGLFDVYLNVWYFDSYLGGNDLSSWLPIHDPAFFVRIFDFSMTMFYQWFLIPFFIVGLYFIIKRRNVTDKIFLLSMFIFSYFFVTKLVEVGSFVRFAILILPFVIITSVAGIMKLQNMKKEKWWKNMWFLIIMILIIASIFQTFTLEQKAISGFPDNENSIYPTTAKFKETAVFLSEEINETTMILTTFGHMQMFEFARWDKNRYIYSMYVPYTKDDWNKALLGDYSYRPSENLWKSFGIDYDKPEYVVIHEKQLIWQSFKYDMNYFENDDRFKLIKTFEGDELGDRTFIFKIITS